MTCCVQNSSTKLKRLLDPLYRYWDLNSLKSKEWMKPRSLCSLIRIPSRKLTSQLLQPGTPVQVLVPVPGSQSCLRAPDNNFRTGTVIQSQCLLQSTWTLKAIPFRGAKYPENSKEMENFKDIPLWWTGVKKIPPGCLLNVTETLRQTWQKIIVNENVCTISQP